MMVFKGFSESSEKSMGIITLEFQIDGWVLETKFHIVDVDTSFNVLLGLPCIQEK